MLLDAEALRSAVESIDQQLQLPVTAILSLDETRADLGQTINNIDQLKADLRKVEDAQPHGLDQESLAQLKASEELVSKKICIQGFLIKFFLNSTKQRINSLFIGQVRDRKASVPMQRIGEASGIDWPT